MIWYGKILSIYSKKTKIIVRDDFKAYANNITETLKLYKRIFSLPYDNKLFVLKLRNSTVIESALSDIKNRCLLSVWLISYLLFESWWWNCEIIVSHSSKFDKSITDCLSHCPLNQGAVSVYQLLSNDVPVSCSCFYSPTFLI